MSDTKTYIVPGMHCGHCKAAVTQELELVEGVASVDVNLESKIVSVTGSDLDDAGYEVAA